MDYAVTESRVARQQTTFIATYGRKSVQRSSKNSNPVQSKVLKFSYLLLRNSSRNMKGLQRCQRMQTFEGKCISIKETDSDLAWSLDTVCLKLCMNGVLTQPSRGPQCWTPGMAQENGQECLGLTRWDICGGNSLGNEHTVIHVTNSVFAAD
ncbi:hypothetical protein AV530_007353 [Patagioenas fasciata monilis]|uniref:Uncharacterized protein n=1 Tax=Patagioenas fasciata monilis TaxID=372326 RepID=A0A1V4JXN9_PATFA|nr:hypothetical protein AV530_007353 [Patagioenas fasciata monilis]